MERTIKIFFGLIVVLIVGMLIIRVSFIMDAKKGGKQLYEISVNKFNETETYMTSSYTRDKETGCIKFKDEFEITRIVCNNYTITEY